VIEGAHSYGSLTDRIAGIPLSAFRARWWLAIGFAGVLTIGGVIAGAATIYEGVGEWGINQPTAWGFAIINFVWWIGIGHAGTLISAFLLLMRQPWRNSINRFAEAMTLFAVMQAGLFPLLHLGRLWRFYWLLPYPDVMRVWPQWRSPLVWDAFAVMTYFTVSVLFWYLGLLPDLASLRDRARRPAVRRLVHVLALGWRGSAAHWHRLETGYLLLAGVATPLVVSVHSIVSLDFAVSLVPGWNATIFPPYFVAGAIYSGFAMVLTLAIPLRSAFGMQDLITTRHLDLMAKVMLVSGLIVAYGYLTEMFTEWLSTEPVESYRLHARLAGYGAWSYWITIVCNVVVGQALWFRRVRTRPVALFVVALIVNVGMYMERYDIIVTGLERDYLPTSWGVYVPTLAEWALLIGTLGLFAGLFLVFIRFVPVSPIYELKELAHRMRRLTETSRAPEVQQPSASGPLYALVAGFEEPGPLLEGVRRMRMLGYTKIEAYSPMPVHGLHKALGRRRSRIPAAALAGGLLGGTCAYLLLYLTAVHDYPWHIGGKPLHSWPSFVPITFEMTILGTSFGAFFGVLRACRLPRLSHPIFATPGFERATRDRFFLAVQCDDPKFSLEGTTSDLSALGPESVVQTREDTR
jgi:Ni/Fe-hydrogenase subunit HybB-like protein